MKENKLLRAVGKIEDKYVDEAAPKRKNKVKIWVKWLSAAAGICLVIAVSILLTRQSDSDQNEDGEATEIVKETGEIKVPETAPGGDVEEGFEYYVYIENGKYKLIEEEEEALESMDIEDVTKKWLLLNNISEVTLNEVKTDHTDAYDKEIIIDGNGYVEHTPASDVYNIYLEGNEFDSKLAVALVNTIISYTENVAGLQYVKPYFNGELMELGVEMYEKGYIYISVDIEGK